MESLCTSYPQRRGRQFECGNGGGLDIVEVRSFPKAWDACVIADKLLAKQINRATKPATPAPAAKAPEAPKPEQPKAETPAQKKAQDHAQIEEKLEGESQQA